VRTQFSIKKSLTPTAFLMLSMLFCKAQSVNFELKTTPDVDFVFNTIDKYTNGIILPHALELNINAVGTQWDLYIGTTTTTAGSWNINTTYSSSGISPPPVSLMQARIYNADNTPVSGNGFIPLTDIATPLFIIGSTLNDPAVNCSDPSPVGTNEAGNYITDPECYKFKVDLKVVPGLNNRP
jgi:hypothetical protein